MGRQRNRAADMADDVRDAAEDALHSAQATLEDGLDDADRYIRRQWGERPLAVTATALGVGLLIGLLLAGRR